MGTDVNEQLLRLYESVFPRFAALKAGIRDVSWPLLLEVPARYSSLRRKLMIVGQETRGWGRGEMPDVAGVVAEYRGFDLARHYRRTPFWVAAHRVAQALNPEGPARSFLWSNLVKASQSKTRPCPAVEQAVCSLGLLPAEIEITRPEVVVFFTGRRYDGRLRETFPGASLERLSPFVCRVTHAGLPFHSYRTYHPAYLRRSRNWGVLDEVVGFASEAARPAGGRFP